MLLREIIDQVADVLHRSLLRDDHPNATKVIVCPDKSRFPGWADVEVNVSVINTGSNFKVTLSNVHNDEENPWRTQEYTLEFVQATLAPDARIISQNYDVLIDFAYMIARTITRYVDDEIKRYVFYSTQNKED